MNLQRESEREYKIAWSQVIAIYLLIMVGI